MNVIRTTIVIGAALLVIGCGGGKKQVDDTDKAQVEEVKDTVNNVYDDPTYGYTITYPKKVFVHDTQSSTADKQVFNYPGGTAEMVIYRDTRLGAKKDTLTLDKTFELDRTTKSDRQVIYNKLKPMSYTITGVEKGKAYCQKSIVRDGVIFTTMIIYPKVDQKVVEPTAMAMLESFR